MYDLELKGLKETISERDVKDMLKVKHVIAAAIDQDSIRNVCVGTGRVQVRLGPGEDIEIVKSRLLGEGLTVTEK